MDTWQARLKHAIEVRAVTKVALAKHVGIKAPSVSAWLSSKSKTMSAEHGIAVCEFLGITQEWLKTHTPQSHVPRSLFLILMITKHSQTVLLYPHVLQERV